MQVTIQKNEYSIDAGHNRENITLERCRPQYRRKTKYRYKLKYRKHITTLMETTIQKTQYSVDAGQNTKYKKVHAHVTIPNTQYMAVAGQIIEYKKKKSYAGHNTEERIQYRCRPQ